MKVGTKQVAAEIGVSRETLYRYMKQGLPYYQLNPKKRAFDMEEVYKWLKTRGIKSNY